MKLLKWIPLLRHTKRIMDIRDFVNSKSSSGDGRTFAELLETYHLLEGLDKENYHHINITVQHETLERFVAHIAMTLELLEEGNPPTATGYTKFTETNLLKWLRSEKGHYNLEDAFELLSNYAINYSDAMELYGETRAKETMSRLVSGTSATFRGLIQALAEKRYDMQFDKEV